MERFHLHTVQQLQLELAEVGERSGTYAGESRAPQVNSKEASHFGQKDLTQLDANGSTRKSGTLSNGNTDNSSVASNGNMVECLCLLFSLYLLYLNVFRVFLFS